MIRRNFVKLAGVGIATPSLYISQCIASGKAEVLLLTCMDYRFLDEVEKFMAKKGLRNKYDHVVLAGAALGAFNTFQEWTKAFFDHVDLAVRLHQIKRIMVIDHVDCGAYKLQFGDTHTESKSLEIQQHTNVMQRLQNSVAIRTPQLGFEGYLMDHTGRANRLL